MTNSRPTTPRGVGSVPRRGRSVGPARTAVVVAVLFVASAVLVPVVDGSTVNARVTIGEYGTTSIDERSATDAPARHADSPPGIELPKLELSVHVVRPASMSAVDEPALQPSESASVAEAAFDRSWADRLSDGRWTVPVAVVDIDAVDSLFARCRRPTPSRLEVTFRYARFDVTVRGTGEMLLQLDSLENPRQRSRRD